MGRPGRPISSITRPSSLKKAERRVEWYPLARDTSASRPCQARTRFRPSVSNPAHTAGSRRLRPSSAERRERIAAVAGEQQHRVEPQVGDLRHEVVAPGLGEHGPRPPPRRPCAAGLAGVGQEARDVRAVRRRARRRSAIVRARSGRAGAAESKQDSVPMWQVGPAGSASIRMASPSQSAASDVDGEDVARRLALLPEPLARAGVEVRRARCRASPRAPLRPCRRA